MPRRSVTAPVLFYAEKHNLPVIFVTKLQNIIADNAKARRARIGWTDLGQLRYRCPMIGKGVQMIMANSNNLVNPNAREAMDRFKMEAASEVGVNLKQGYNGDLTSKQAGSVGGQMVKKMIEAYVNGMK